MANGNVYQMVTDRIIAELEKGIIPWKKPWTGSNKGAFNRISKKPYSLMNQILLGKSGEWASFKQWQELGIETPQTFKNSAAYIQNWLQVLKNDNKFIVSAASKAEKAVNYIMAEA